MLKKIIKKRAYTGNKIEDNLLFVTLQTQIVGLDMNNGYKQIFLSDKFVANACDGNIKAVIDERNIETILFVIIAFFI